MNEFLHQLASGLALGGVYAIMALALVMIYQATQLVNFAQGEMAMFSTYFAWKLMDMGWPYWRAFGATVLVSFVGGVVIERVVVRPFAKAPVLASVIVFIGLALIFNALAGWLYGFSVTSFDTPFSGRPWFGNVYMSAHESGAVLVSLCVLALVYAFFRFTPLGLAMRAAAQNPVSSRLVGIRVGWMLAIGWGLAAAIGAIAGMMAAPIVYLDPEHDGRHSDLRLRRGGARRHRQSVRRGVRRICGRRAREPRSAPMSSARRSSSPSRSPSSSAFWSGARPASSDGALWRGSER